MDVMEVYAPLKAAKSTALLGAKALSDKKTADLYRQAVDLPDSIDRLDSGKRDRIAESMASIQLDPRKRKEAEAKVDQALDVNNRNIEAAISGLPESSNIPLSQIILGSSTIKSMGKAQSGFKAGKKEASDAYNKVITELRKDNPDRDWETKEY